MYIKLQSLFPSNSYYRALINIPQHRRNFSRDLRKMGGSAFNSSKYGNLQTPRIPNHIYQRLLSEFKLTLSKFYSKVDSSIPAPGKRDHGDIDILVEAPLGSPPSSKGLQSILNATACIDSSPTANFAIWDDELAAYVQLDVHNCRPGGIDWECFHRAYGDLWNILGVMGKPYGISVNDTGVRISAQGIEKRNRKASMLFLTDSPREAIKFFGCDWEKYENGFQTVEELFAFCAQSRFLYHEETSWKLIGRREEGRLKEKRPLCRKWVIEYLPSLIGSNRIEDQKTTTHPKITRGALLEEALTKFDKWDEYRSLITNWNKEVFDKEMWGRIARLLPVERNQLGLILRPLKKRLEEEDEKRGEGTQVSKEEWECSRESRWTVIALDEWKALLEVGLVESEERKKEGVEKSEKNRRV